MSPVVQLQVVSRYDITPVVDVCAAVQGRDLDAVAKEVQKAVDDIRPKPPRGAQVTIRGQVSTMGLLFFDLGVGPVMAIMLAYLLIVVSFQSWTDPLIIMITPPAVLAGTAWVSSLTETTLSVLSSAGAIITMGVATTNSVLLISFARERLAEGTVPVQVALEASVTHLHPVLMTVLTMIIGAVPMALGLSKGTEQNAPLRRAAIGGLLFTTISTLFFVPVVFASVHSRLQQRATRHSQDLRGNEGHV